MHQVRRLTIAYHEQAQAPQGVALARPPFPLRPPYTPTSGSWLNAVETFFSALTRRRLKRGSFHSVVDLQAAIRRYIAEQNADPKPFTWTKTPAQILKAESSECAGPLVNVGKETARSGRGSAERPPPGHDGHDDAPPDESTWQ